MSASYSKDVVENMLLESGKDDPLNSGIRFELKTLEWWILRLILDPLFFLISRLT